MDLTENIAFYTVPIVLCPKLGRIFWLYGAKKAAIQRILSPYGMF